MKSTILATKLTLLAASGALAQTIVIPNGATTSIAVGQQLQNAVAQANANPSITRIEIAPTVDNQTILLDETIDYVGSQSLTIIVQEQALLAIRPIEGAPFQGDSFFSVESAPPSFTLSGIELIASVTNLTPNRGVEVSPNSSNSQNRVFFHLANGGMYNFGEHAVFMEDNGLALSLIARLFNSRFLNNGFNTNIDSEGSVTCLIRESGSGNARANATRCDFELSHNDAIQVDESGAGEASANLHLTTFMTIGEDAIDIDEQNDGDVYMIIRQSHFSGVQGSCLDLDERSNGDLDLISLENEYLDLLGSAIKIDESGDDENGTGDTIIQSRGDIMTVLNSDDQPIDVDAYGSGSITAQLKSLDIVNANPQSINDEGIQIEEFNDGDLNLVIESNVSISTSPTERTLDLQESGNGNLNLIDIDDATLTGRAPRYLETGGIGMVNDFDRGVATSLPGLTLAASESYVFFDYGTTTVTTGGRTYVVETDDIGLQSGEIDNGNISVDGSNLSVYEEGDSQAVAGGNTFTLLEINSLARFVRFSIQ